MKDFILALFSLLFLFSFSAQAFITVGNDGQCDFNSITDAVVQASANQDFEIRIAYNKIYFENLTFDTVPVSLIGGFANCNDASNNSVSATNYTKIDGSNLFKPVIVIKNIASTSANIKFSQLEIYNGLGNSLNPSGGITIKDVDVRFAMKQLYLHDNTSEKGGAVYATRFDSTGFLNTILMDSINFDSNTAKDGGGLYCRESHIYIYGQSVIQSNQALGPGGGSRDGEGGGIYATDNCQLNFYAGSTNFSQGIVSNTANGNGGGIYASMAATVVLDGYGANNLGISMGDANTPVNVTNNLTNFHDGAGIYADGIATQVFAYGAIINFNAAAGSYGGGVAVNNSAQFTMLRKADHCWDNYLCNQIYGNKVFSSTGFPSYGGALSGQNQAEIIIKQAIIKHNQAQRGTAVYLNNSTITMESSMLYKNGQFGSVANLQDESLVDLVASPSATFAFSTFVDNQVTQTVFDNLISPIKLYSSIIQDGVSVYQTATLNPNEVFECLLTHENVSFNGTNGSIVGTPNFIDVFNEDYHLQNNSLGVDMCFAGIFPPTVADIDGELRNGMYNAGADETSSFIDLIFKNGFE